MDRRTAIRAIASSLAVPVAGCFDSSGSTETTTSSATVRNHPAAHGIETQPTLGPSPLDGGSVIVAFEDPSCPPCGRFERTVFPKIRDEWTEQGKVSFVYRSLPIVYEWGGPATAALEGTYERASTAFWALKAHYYETQDAFTSDNVRERTRTFLESETDIDADSVLKGVDADRYEDAIAVDREAAARADVDSTPTFALFKRGTFLTLIHGNHSFKLFESALDLKRDDRERQGSVETGT
ncbi:thioredoxin domain-containing protein [Halorubrum sp. CBA1125]|uniref:DsbA family protein n=1 Tax=Halorubrum sp. CBA1125 TaxID=2668072 RepID=UPI0018D27255|nr:thioredoxin domain-containing protein [Halorubrum sp. CBA1125]